MKYCQFPNTFPLSSLLFLQLVHLPFIRCRFVSESHIHLFRDCWESGILWSFIFQRLRTNWNFNFRSFFSLTWKDWLIFNLSQDKDWKVLFCVAMWPICISRNNAVFEQKLKKSFSVYNSFYVDYISTKKIMQGQETQIPKLPQIPWSPPAYDFLKLNVNGSWQRINESGRGGCSEVSQGIGTWGFLARSMQLLL